MSPVMSTEARLRAATRAAADTVAPGSAPPLRLPGDPAAGPLPGFYLDQTEPEIAATMGISRGTVKSTTSRALAALGRLLQEAGR